MTIEVCRIVEGWDSKQEANRWVEAKLITPQGEEVIQRVEYYDERYKSDLGFELKYMFSLVSRTKIEERSRKASELRHNAYARLTALLLQDGWEPTATNQAGLITMMKREKP